VLIGERHRVFAATFGAMAFSTFVFDTLDVSTRLGRYILQELFGWSGRRGALLATTLTILTPLALLLAAGEGAYRLFWVLFGTSNQLLAALSLLGICVWLRRSGRRSLFVWLPMAFVMLVTVSSLLLQVVAALRTLLATGARLDAPTLNGAVSLLLLVLAVVLALEAAKAMRARAPLPATSA
jgi:carbon starvation protein